VFHPPLDGVFPGNELWVPNCNSGRIVWISGWVESRPSLGGPVRRRGYQYSLEKINCSRLSHSDCDAEARLDDSRFAPVRIGRQVTLS